MSIKRALNEKEAAVYISMSRSFLRQSRTAGHYNKKDASADDEPSDDGETPDYKPLENRTPGPRYIRIGSRAIRYLVEDLDAWLEQFRVDTTQIADLNQEGVGHD